MKDQGFTLVEVTVALVIVATIIIVSGLLYVGFHFLFKI